MRFLIVILSFGLLLPSSGVFAVTNLAESVGRPTYDLFSKRVRCTAKANQFIKGVAVGPRGDGVMGWARQRCKRNVKSAFNYRIRITRDQDELRRLKRKKRRLIQRCMQAPRKCRPARRAFFDRL